VRGERSAGKKKSGLAGLVGYGGQKHKNRSGAEVRISSLLVSSNFLNRCYTRQFFFLLSLLKKSTTDLTSKKSMVTVMNQQNREASYQPQLWHRWNLALCQSHIHM
jgi:hypothetical protein